MAGEETGVADATTDAPIADTDTDTDAAVAADAQALQARARRMGWRPKEEFRGDPGRWSDAREFIDRGETELPVLRERYRALDDRFAKLEERSQSTEKELTERLKEISSAFGEFREFANKSEERSYIRARSELEARMAAAVDVADRGAYSQARAELDALDRDRVAAAPAAKPAVKDPAAPADKQAATAVHPEVTAWVAENNWFNSDEAMRGYAIAVHGQLLKDRPGLTMRDNLADVRADVMARFPEKFGNPKRNESAAVTTSGTPPPPRRKGKFPDFNEWPAEAKASYAKFSKQIPNYTREEYAKLYFAGDES